MSRTFVVSTDGYISADGQVFDLIRQNLGSANLFAFGIGSSVNRHLIEGMAHAGQGEAFVLTRPDQAAAETERFRAYVSTPVLSNVTLTTSGFAVKDLEPVQLPDVLADRPVVCLGKWTGGPHGTVTVSGMTGAGPWHQTFDVAAVSDRSHPALRQLWARQRLQRLSDYDQFGADEARKAEVTRLGLAYHLLTATTSFVAVDTEIRNAGGQATTVTQPLPMPEGVSDAAIGGNAQALAFMAPGVAAPAPSQMAQGRAAKVAPYRAAACVEVMATAAGAPAAEAAPPKVRVSALSGAPPADATSLRQEIDQKLADPSLRSLLAALPASARLVLKVDASGQVVSAAFRSPASASPVVFPRCVLAANHLRGWRLQAWHAGARGTLEIQLDLQG